MFKNNYTLESWAAIFNSGFVFARLSSHYKSINLQSDNEVRRLEISAQECLGRILGFYNFPECIASKYRQNLREELKFRNWMEVWDYYDNKNSGKHVKKPVGLIEFCDKISKESLLTLNRLKL